MATKPVMACLCALYFLGGCAQLEAITSAGAQRGGPCAEAAASATEGAVYVNPDAQAGAVSLRNVYIAPANLANMQVIQPEGAPADGEWWVTDEEGEILQRAIAYEFSVALGYKSAFNIVHGRAQADIVVNMALVAVHPNETRASAARDGRTSGAITASVTAVDVASGAVLVRSVVTSASDDIWAFNKVKKDDPAFNPLFRAWGDNLRRGLLQLQGRVDD